MKKRTISLFMSLVVIISLCITPANAASGTYSAEQTAQITQLEKEIADLQIKMDACGTSVGVIGTVVDTTSYYIIKGSGVDMGSIIGGNKYSVVDNPQDGYEYFGQYMGRHKKLGTITVTLNGQSITCNHYGTMGSKYYELLKAKTAKEKQLQAIKDNPALLSGTALGECSNSTSIALQVGNTEMVAYGQYTEIDSPPVVVNGSTLLPIRSIIELSCGTVEWDATAAIITINLGNKVVQLKSNSTTATVNGSTVTMATPAQIINSRFMVPVRFVAENLGMTVNWIADKKVIVITNPNYSTDKVNSRLTLSGDYYIYSDQITYGCTFSYPTSWGKPSVGMYDIKITMPYAVITISRDQGMSDANISKIKQPDGDFEAIPLTEKNTGITAISRTTAAYSKNSNTGEIRILASNGYVFVFNWILNNMDTGLDQTLKDTYAIAQSFSEWETVG